MTHAKTPHVVDARFLEPPAPFVQTMEMLDTLKEGEQMLLLLYREPHPLYQVLKRNGHAYSTELMPDGTFEILISR
jgi:tRNA 2-thiouridine synthesizing protein A